MDKYYTDDKKMLELKELYESMEFAEASDTMTEPAVVDRPVAPPKEAPRDVQDKYVQDLKRWMDYNASSPAGAAKAKAPTSKMVKKPAPGTAREEEEGSGVMLNVDALLNDGQGNYFVSPHDQVLFLYRRPTDTTAGEPVLHPDARQFSHSDKIWIYRRFIKPNGELTQKGVDTLQGRPQELELILDNFLDKITADKGEGLPDNTLSRSVVALEDPAEPLTEVAQGQLDRRYQA